MAVEFGYNPLGRYSSARDDILHWMCMSDWANESSGNSEAPTGYFWRISNFDHDLAQPNNEFHSFIDGWFEENPEVTDAPELRAELVGHFIVQIVDSGFVYVAKFDTKRELLEAYAKLEADFEEWDSQDDED